MITGPYGQPFGDWLRDCGATVYDLAFYARRCWVPDSENPLAESDHRLVLRYAVGAASTRE